MYAIVETGGTQVPVTEGATIRVQKLPQKVGEKVTFKPLFVKSGEKVYIGDPFVENASVEAEVAHIYRDEKILIFKKKRRTKYRRMRGHRQTYAELTIKKITVA